MASEKEYIPLKLIIIKKKEKSNSVSKLSKFVKGEFGLVLILILLCITFTASSRFFLTSSNLLNITRQISIVLTVSIGMLCVVLLREIDLSVGSTAALSGIACAWTIVNTGSQTLGIITGLATGVIVGTFNGFMVVYGRIPSFIVTIASMGIVRGIGLVWTNGKAISGLPETFSFIGASRLFDIIPVSTIISLILVAIAYLFIHKTKHGVYIKAIGANTEAATLSAIPINRYKMIGFITSGFMSSIGGIINTSKLLSATPTACVGLEMDVLSAVILGGAALSGGVGTVTGALVGALTIGVINNGMNLLGITPFFQQIVKGLIILVAVLIKRNKKL